MKTAWAIVVIVMLCLGCTRHTAAPPSKRISPFSQNECEKWLNECVIVLVRKQGSTDFEFHGIGANDVAFLPKTNAVEEILAQCQKVSARSDTDLKKFRVWLAARVGEMHQIKRGTTRGEVNNIMEENGVISTTRATL